MAVDRSGYNRVVRNGKTWMEHRWVMSQHLGRPLTTDEVVHHKDGNKLNNDITNLELLTRAEHDLHHAIERTGTNQTERRCYKCKTTKPIDEFTQKGLTKLSRLPKYSHECKACRKLYQRGYAQGLRLTKKAAESDT